MCWTSLASMGRTARTLIAVLLVPVLAVSQEAKQEEVEPPAESATKISIEDFFALHREPTPEERYQKSIVEAARFCRRTGRSLPECWEDASPAKCKVLVYPAFVEKGGAMRAWQLCIRTCADAGYWSRTFGECRTELDPVANDE